MLWQLLLKPAKFAFPFHLLLFLSKVKKKFQEDASKNCRSVFPSGEVEVEKRGTYSLWPGPEVKALFRVGHGSTNRNQAGDLSPPFSCQNGAFFPRACQGILLAVCGW